MKIESLIPRLLTGGSDGLHRSLEVVARWDEETAKKEIGKIPERYTEISGEPLSSYTGLQICAEINSTLRLMSNSHYTNALKEISKLALHYHNTQFETK